MPTIKNDWATPKWPGAAAGPVGIPRPADIRIQLPLSAAAETNVVRRRRAAVTKSRGARHHQHSAVWHMSGSEVMRRNESAIFGAVLGD